MIWKFSVQRKVQEYAEPDTIQVLCTDRNEVGKETMCKAMEDMRNETATATNIVAIKNIMNKLSYTVEQAMDLIGIPESQRKHIIDKLQ